MKALLLAAACGFAWSGASPAYAEGMNDFADAVKDATGDYHRAWVLTKLTTFKLGPKCWAKLPDKNQGAVHMASFATRDIAALAKAWTRDDWSAVETQNNNDRENNRKLLEPMMDAFKQRLSITVNVDGDDCDATQRSLWLGYWGQVASTLVKFPPPSGKAFVTINASSKTRDVKVTVGRDGATFTIDAPKTIEAKDAHEKLERPFRQLASGITDDFAFASKESTGDYYAAWVLTKLHTFKVGKKCRAKLADKEMSAVHSASYVVRDIASWAKRDGGAEDWDAIEGQASGDPEANRALVEKDIDALAKRFRITVAVDGDDCDAKHNSLWLKYWTAVASALDDYPPKAKKVAITLKVVAKAKDVNATASKDGATFTIMAPRDVEPAGWSDKIEAAFKKVARKK